MMSQNLRTCQVYDQNFYGGVGGDGWGGGNSERGLKWSGMRGIIKQFFRKHHEIRVRKGKNCS